MAKAKIKVEQVDDLTVEEAGAYGELYVAKIGSEFTSGRRTTAERARAEAEAYLAAKAEEE